MLIAHCPDGFAVTCTRFRSLSYNILPPGTGSLVLIAANQLQSQKHVNSVVIYINGFNAVKNYNAPNGDIITGIYTHHDSGRE